MLLDHAALRIDQERSGQRGHSAVIVNQFLGGHHDGIIHSEPLRELLHFLGSVFVFRSAHDQQLILVRGLELDEFGNLFAARRAPGGPEIQDHDLALGIGDGHDFAVQVAKQKRGRGFRILGEANHLGILRICF